jgi:hypothetical protein
MILSIVFQRHTSHILIGRAIVSGLTAPDMNLIKQHEQVMAYESALMFLLAMMSFARLALGKNDMVTG